MAISLRLLPLQETDKHDDNTTPTGVAGQLQRGGFILLTLLGEVDCCYNLMTFHIPNHFLGSLVECIHCFQCHDVLEEQNQCMSSTANGCDVRVGQAAFMFAALSVSSANTFCGPSSLMTAFSSSAM
jgi:hypothetical protein